MDINDFCKKKFHYTCTVEGLIYVKLSLFIEIYFVSSAKNFVKVVSNYMDLKRLFRVL